MVEYGGPHLKSKTQYDRKVRVWDEHDDVGKYYDSVLETALLEKSEWKAKWIGGNNLLRKEFITKKQLRQARAYVTGIAYYELYINGRKVGDQLLTPSYTDYVDRVEYQAYDITEYLNIGYNVIGIMLGDQWSEGFKKYHDRAYYHGEVMAILQVELEYTDSSREMLVTDESWRCSNSPVVESSVFHGEIYDANLEQQGWNLPGFDESSWEYVRIMEKQPELFLQMIPPIKAVAELKPVLIHKINHYTYMYINRLLRPLY